MDWQLRLLFVMSSFPGFEAGCTRLCACDLPWPYGGGTACKTPRSGRAQL